MIKAVALLSACKMAVSRRGYIYGVFLLSILNVVIVILSLATGSWIVTTEQFSEGLQGDASSSIQYGLFRGELVLGHLTSPTLNEMFMVCVMEENACALSCRPNDDVRRQEVTLLAQGKRFTPSCGQTNIDIDEQNPLRGPAVISAALYISLIVIFALQLIFAIASVVLSLVNATRNPIEPIWGLPGVLGSNCIVAVSGTTILLMFGIYWATSGLQDHLAFSFTAVEELVPESRSLGYSYWLTIISVLCSLINVGLIEIRKYLLEKSPPAPTITIENHSDGSIFLY